MRISEEFHAFIKAHKRDEETMEEALRRLVGGPHPEDVAGILSTESAEKMRHRLDAKAEQDTAGKAALQERFR